MQNKPLFWGLIGAALFVVVLLILMLFVQGQYLRTQVVGQPIETAATGACYFDAIGVGAVVTVCEDGHTKLSCIAAGGTDVQWHEASICMDDSDLVPSASDGGTIEETIVP